MGATGVRLRLCRGDLTGWQACAVAVSSNITLAGNNNPAYWRFAGRDGTNGAIHAAAGPELLAAVRALPAFELPAADVPRASGVGRERLRTRCAVGSAVATPAFGSLRCEHVIHAVCPDGLYVRSPSTAAAAAPAPVLLARPGPSVSEMLGRTCPG